MSDAPTSFAAALDEIRPNAYPAAELTDIAAKEIENPIRHPRSSPHEILARLEGMGSIMSLARTRKRISATQRREPSVRAMAFFIKQSMSSPQMMNDATIVPETARNMRNARQGNKGLSFPVALIFQVSI